MMSSDTPKWLDEQLITTAIREGKGDHDITVRKINVRPATSAGDNYFSVLYRVNFEYATHNDSSSEESTESFIIKSLPDAEKAKQFVTENDAFATETEVLRRLIPAFHRLLNTSTSDRLVYLAPKYYYHTDKPHQKIVMEDLWQSGFKMVPRTLPLDLDHSKLAISQIGMFHAASYALHRQDPHAFDNFLKFPFLKNYAYESLLNFTFTLVADYLQSFPDVDQQYSEKLRYLGGTGFRRIEKAAKREEHGFNVLNHGDAWRNNMMFKYDEEGNASDVVFVDFQYSYYGSPALDLHYFLYSSPSSEVSSRHFDQLLQCYHSSLSKTLARMGCGDQCPSMGFIQEEMEKRNFFAVFAAIAVMPLRFVSSDKVADFAKACKNEPNLSCSHITKEYIDEILTILPMFNKKYWLD
ncbi:hypothetical protein PR048_032783 [Dryococelus australis]|uniref:CHK kinase-like domain-containing protein n=1 Tax=Dryococelus australis TaxID=614101 RepID=A0ABQ9G603_9NEOP|nr:hypothetical protein PR048_032783 [Dryococelus australis]